MKFNIGDRVLIKSETYSKKAIVLKRVKNGGNRYYIKCLDIYNVNTTNVETWVGEDKIESDINYYIELRDNKLKKLGI